MEGVCAGLSQDEVGPFCERMMALGATRCEPAAQADGSFNVLVVFPDGDSDFIARSGPFGSGDGPDWIV